MFNQRKYQ